MRNATFWALFVTALAASMPNLAGQTKEAPSRADTSAPLIQSIEGPNLYHAYCASCHGADAKGTGPMVASLKVKPSDLTTIAIHNGGVFPKARIERIISGEELTPSGHGSSAMPVWGPIFSRVTSDVDYGRVRVDNLARYLNGIQQK